MIYCHRRQDFSSVDKRNWLGPNTAKFTARFRRNQVTFFWDFGDFKFAALASCLVTTTFPGNIVHELLFKLMLILSNFRLLFISTGLHFGARRQ